MTSLFIYAADGSEFLGGILILGVLVMFFVKNGFGLLGATGFMAAIFGGTYALFDESVYNLTLFSVDMFLAFGFMIIQSYVDKKGKEQADAGGKPNEKF